MGTLLWSAFVQWSIFRDLDLSGGLADSPSGVLLSELSVFFTLLFQTTHHPPKGHQLS